jgi:beta-N-acetylhexosaminidase
MGSMRRIGLIALAGVFLAVPAAARAQDDSPSVDGLTIRQLVGQRLILSYDGTTPPSRVTERIKRGEAAGVILFARNVGSREGLRRTMAQLQALPRPAGLRQPLLIMIDQEGGLVKRLSGAPNRSPAQVGATNDPAVSRESGRQTARNLKGVGVNVNLAPVLDIGRPGAIVRRLGRSYGSTASRVIRMGVPFAQGHADEDVIATTKHFPGIGDATVDEDVAPNRSTRSLSFLRNTEMAPFAAAFRARVPMVMTSTSVYTALDASRPALLSAKITTGELRDRLKFTGVSITDDLDVGALDRFGSGARLGLRAARAGNDLLLYAQSYANAAAGGAAIIRAAGDGDFTRENLEQHAQRVLALRASLG